MDPDGILKAWTMNVLMNRASMIAIANASAYSLKGLFLGIVYMVLRFSVKGVS